MISNLGTVEQIEKSVTLLGFIRDWRIEGKLLPQYWRGKQRLKTKNKKQYIWDSYKRYNICTHGNINRRNRERKRDT